MAHRLTNSKDGRAVPSKKIEPSDHTRSAPHFLTVAEVATLLHVSNISVYRLADRGELPSYRICHKRLFKHVDVLNFIESCATPHWKQ